MKYVFVPCAILMSLTFIFAQKNCNVYKGEGDVCSYKACVFLQEAPSYFQLRREYHEIHDKAIEICPEYGDAYRAKSVAYLKTGDFITWKRLMDRAVELHPVENLGYRGWSHFQFFRDYESAIADIEKLARLTDQNIGYSQNGMYHLNIAKALCYKMIGEKKKAIAIIEDQIQADGDKIGLYDYLHLGVLFLEMEQFKKAENALLCQLEEYDCAENRYYLALVYKALKHSNSYFENIHLARSLYEKNRIMTDPYTHQIDKIYQRDINAELQLTSTE